MAKKKPKLEERLQALVEQAPSTFLFTKLQKLQGQWESAQNDKDRLKVEWEKAKARSEQIKEALLEQYNSDKKEIRTFVKAQAKAEKAASKAEKAKQAANKVSDKLQAKKKEKKPESPAQ